jgi:ribokinase
MAFWAEGQRTLPAFEVDVVDTTGAGDAFDAGFIVAARLRGLGIDDALAYANAVAAVKVTRPGARAVPTHEEVLAFLAARA